MRRRYILGNWLFFGPLTAGSAGDEPFTVVVRASRGLGVIWRYFSPRRWMVQVCLWRLTIGMGPPLEWPTWRRDERWLRVACALWSAQWWSA